MEHFGNTYQFPENIAGTWHQEVFKNENPIILELACGRGEYSVGLARHNAATNIIGVDIKGSRIWRGAKTAIEEGLNNAAFLRTYIERIATYFNPGEVSEIWITFPDPHPPAGHAKKRLSSLRFLKEYTQFVKDGGTVHLKTDDDMLYRFTKAGAQALGMTLLDDVDDVLKERANDPVLSIRTTYELRWISEGKKIRYIAMKLDHALFEEANFKRANEKMKEWLSVYNVPKEP
ncbi:MAG: tRNA (guanosine(46)-N7)-methyltransferase TrmB [Bacteroidota bacterium]|nr:tRNA (guanosine(46)-N7)-methyltransferase TrmB [Bacteroidota bacterium]MDX5431198.1 tRNA (guanosine(46)-N7)-methyltransferase TrmB [Bacteroidota bacterium]MDX5469937.1 tRNA (guanosine(46)-N7)-methyltransferase TrmB [Bacteroidota bacterium]